MEKKIIALGNISMCDDGIGVKVLEFLTSKLTLLGFHIIMGETDINYCLNKIENDDFIIILDSSYYGIQPGNVTVTPLKEIDICSNNYLCTHAIDLVKALDSSNKKVHGFIINIEAYEFYFNFDLSPDLEMKFSEICKQCLEHITFISSCKDDIREHMIS
ncbi:hydrogenase maturation protease [Clostridium sp. DJ247]|uniref:hydrogenase maturation protease n=1 Tax=Clostridium sp. DJ247 TaxID=2726188 RepID=UPI00162AF3D9|nr:hydrogenase maturation protease [Clostridium sp. DJ247]MBC2579052.1 hydrogenase maturation protease [Clostridium sp. DJ247]